MALLDGYGEEWQRVSAEICNTLLRIAKGNGVNVADDEFRDARAREYFQSWNPPDESAVEEATLDQWAAAEQMLKGLAGF